MSSTMEGECKAPFWFAVLKYYPLPVQSHESAKCMLSYSKRYVWLTNRLGETLVADLSRCEES